MKLLVEGKRGPEEATIQKHELQIAGKNIGSGTIFFLFPDQDVVPSNFTSNGAKEPKKGKTIVLLRKEETPFRSKPIVEIVEN